MKRAALFLSFLLSLPLPSSLGAEPLNPSEVEVEELSFGSLGVLTFANEVRDVIEGQSFARIYLDPYEGSPKLLLERPSSMIEDAWSIDFNGDGVKEIGVLWRSFGKARFGRFEIFSLASKGRMERIFPKRESVDRAHLRVLFPEDISGLYGKLKKDRELPPLESIVFALEIALCEVSRESPLLKKRVFYGNRGGGLRVLTVDVDEAEQRHQELNLAAEFFREGKNEEALQLARRTLERIRLTGPNYLMADAYLLVAKGYRLSGSSKLAKIFKRRAALKDDLWKGRRK